MSNVFRPTLCVCCGSKLSEHGHADEFTTDDDETVTRLITCNVCDRSWNEEFDLARLTVNSHGEIPQTPMQALISASEGLLNFFEGYEKDHNVKLKEFSNLGEAIVRAKEQSNE
ncbi:hypothetical protein [Kiloniella sp.]|uniref:hypothetical protein n=1 Tax=Kiloniella sp. TaxID=1938587 RepID=UPI003B028584